MLESFDDRLREHLDAWFHAYWERVIWTEPIKRSRLRKHDREIAANRELWMRETYLEQS